MGNCVVKRTLLFHAVIHAHERKRLLNAAAFTLDVYGHVTDKMKKDSTARMDAFIKGIKSSKG